MDITQNQHQDRKQENNVQKSQHKYFAEMHLK